MGYFAAQCQLGRGRDPRHGDAPAGLESKLMPALRGMDAAGKSAAEGLGHAERPAAGRDGVSPGRRGRDNFRSSFREAFASRRSPARAARSCSIACPRMRPAFSASPGCLTGEEYAAEAVAETDVVAYALRPAGFRAHDGRVARSFGPLCSAATASASPPSWRASRTSPARASTCGSLNGCSPFRKRRPISKRLSKPSPPISARRAKWWDALLRNFERAGWVSLSRGALEIVDTAALKGLLTERD